MSADWKMMLYEYAKRHNETAVQGNLGAIEDLVDDEQFLLQESGRLRAAALDWKRRNLKPLKSQTRAKILRVNEEDRWITADLRLERRLSYVVYGEHYDEDRVILERITLKKNERGWRIAAVQPFVAERQPVPGAMRLGIDEAHPALPAGPGPLLNTHVLFGAQGESVRHGSRKAAYDRQKAKQYADRHWNSSNPAFLEFGVDCTNYVSQCLLAGGAPMNYTGRREAGWWYQGRKNNREWWSYSWSVSNALRHYLSTSRSGLQAEVVHSQYALELGDVIFYDWDGDGAYQHSTIVTGFDAAGEPLVNAHTANSRARLWSYRDSPAWSERTRYSFFHIADYF